ncbi:methionyl-tRNA formyltransferase, partial [Candidatus Microgenomates bacterium]|nr:methionyl-tRNA formyltransferase [Candidatus Microgenomates bacterium]
MKKTQIIFFGSSHHSLPTLKTLLKEESCKITAIVSQPDRPVGRKQILTPTPVSQFAQKHKIPLFTPLSQKNKPWLYQNPKKLAGQLKPLKPDLLISAYYGQKIPQEIIKLAQYGGLNLHPSLLPKYRGASPVKWAIYNGEKETGITILKIAENFDQGEIAAQEKVKIQLTDTAETLLARLFEKGAKLLIKT